MKDENPVPDVYRLAQAYPVEAVTARAQSLLPAPIVHIERDRIAGSHAVYYVVLESGGECVVRVATHPEHDLPLQIWVTEQCRSLGLPVPETLAVDLTPADGSPPLMISERMPGVSAYDAPLRQSERHAVFEQMGKYAARLHCIALSGFGSLQPNGNGYAGSFASISAWICADIAAKLSELPDSVLPPERKTVLQDRFAHEQAALERHQGVLLHGDFRFKNILLNGLQVSAVLDFEMALSGDPAMDIAWLIYSDGKDDTDLAAVRRGYESESRIEDRANFHTRLLLYQLRYALEHLWWEVNFQNEAGIRDVLRRIYATEQALDMAKTMG
jgi:aminoglycoside phosphotransferase (APT) family kinase protein